MMPAPRGMNRPDPCINLAPRGMRPGSSGTNGERTGLIRLRRCMTAASRRLSGASCCSWCVSAFTRHARRRRRLVPDCMRLAMRWARPVGARLEPGEAGRGMCVAAPGVCRPGANGAASRSGMSDPVRATSGRAWARLILVRVLQVILGPIVRTGARVVGTGRDVARRARACRGKPLRSARRCPCLRACRCRPGETKPVALRAMRCAHRAIQIGPRVDPVDGWHLPTGEGGERSGGEES